VRGGEGCRCVRVRVRRWMGRLLVEAMGCRDLRVLRGVGGVT
jgi:hypothetical protein